jgi:hypothetical protein
MNAVNTCRMVEGRLLEINVAGGYRSVEDVAEMTRRIRTALAAVPESKRLIIAADWRNCPLFSEAVARSVTSMLTVTGTRVERSAILHRPDQATSVLQVFRLIKEANQDHRRVFHRVEEMYGWLGELLTATERRRLREFLSSAEHSGAQPAPA